MRLRAIILLLMLVAACGDRNARSAGEVRADSTAGIAVQPAPAVTNGDTTGIAVTPVAGGELSAPDTDTSNTPRVSGGTPPSTPPQPAPPASDPAEQTEDGAAILRRAAAAYENVRTLRADFVMLYENTLLRQKTTSRGTLYQRRPDRIALRFTDPAGDMLIGDGERFYWYTPSVDAQQVLCAPATEGGAGAVDLQAQFVGNPVERFQFTQQANETVDGRPAHVLTLVPRQRAEYRSLKVWLDTRDSLARRFEITEHNGTVRRFDLDNMVTNPSIPDATFRFVRPDNARIVGCQ